MEKDWQKRYWELASGLVEATQKKAEPVIRALVKQGEIAAERAEKGVDELLKVSQANRKAIAAVVRSETEKAVDRLGLVRQRDVKQLERKIEKLERQVAGGAAKKTAAAKRSSAAKSSAKKSSAKQSSAKKTTAKKSAAAKRAAKKSTPPSGGGGS